MSDAARRAILASIRRNLAVSAPYDAAHAQRPDPPTPTGRARGLPVLNGAAAPPPPLPEDPVARFRMRLEGVAGHFLPVAGIAGAAAVLEQIAGGRKVAVSDSPLARQAAEGLAPLHDPLPAQLFDCDVGVTEAQWGIAETGTLVLESGRERHRFVSLIPRVHVALLRADRLVDTLADALRQVRETRSAAVTFVTGPSRTSDIELTLAIGVHGPQELYVLLLEGA